MNNLITSICNICDYEYLYFLNKKNVVGVGLGYRTINNYDTSELCIKVFVIKKVSNNLLSSYDRIPLFYKSIKTDVIESGPFKTMALKDKIRPVVGGYSLGNVLIRPGGTMGCLVTDGHDIFILSNNHILADGNKSPLGTFIIQPSLSDGGNRQTDIVAILSQFIEIKYKSGSITPENYVDCAIAKIINPTIASSSITLVGNLESVIVPRLRQKVQKVGRTTELTLGEVYSIHASLTTESETQEYLLKDQIIATEFSDVGDSGSILLDMHRNAVGLLVGGTGLNYSFHNPITTVLDALNVRLFTS